MKLRIITVSLFLILTIMNVIYAYSNSGRLRNRDKLMNPEYANDEMDTNKLSYEETLDAEDEDGDEDDDEEEVEHLDLDDEVADEANEDVDDFTSHSQN